MVDRRRRGFCGCPGGSPSVRHGFCAAWFGEGTPGGLSPVCGVGDGVPGVVTGVPERGVFASRRWLRCSLACESIMLRQAAEDPREERDVLDSTGPGELPYGIPPPAHRLPAATRVGGVHLLVSDLARSRDFYEQILGLRSLGVDARQAAFGAPGDDRPLVTLKSRPGVAGAR